MHFNSSRVDSDPQPVPTHPPASDLAQNRVAPGGMAQHPHRRCALTELQLLHHGTQVQNNTLSHVNNGGVQPRT